VARLQAGYDRYAEAYAKLQKAKALVALEIEHAKLKHMQVPKLIPSNTSNTHDCLYPESLASH
jgi:hypothetical protein